MSVLKEAARAKLNLTLKVHGRRADGYHELESLVAFAELADAVSLDVAREPGFEARGPFAGEIDGENLMEKAVRAASAHFPGLNPGLLVLEKHLPVAAGLGGGSADAAAALRLLDEANPERPTMHIAESVACALGSDILACLKGDTALMQGRGELLSPVAGLPRAGVVLANPGAPLSAAEIYAELGAPSLEEDFAPQTAPLDFEGDFDRLIAYLETRGNDLQAPAERRLPEITDVLNALRELEGAMCARLSGSGPTCFALFRDEATAQDEAERFAHAHPKWWVEASIIGS